MRRYITKPLLSYVILALALTFAVYQIQDATTDRLRSGLVSSCERVNVLRAQSNLSDVTSFNVLSATIKQELVVLDKGKTTPATRIARRAAIEKFVKEANRLTVTGLTDCDRAVNNPESYDIPVADPIGDPLTGKIKDDTQQIIDQSEKFLVERR